MRASVRAIATCGVLVVAQLLTACASSENGSGGSPSASAPSGADPGLMALVPESVRADGSLSVAVDASYPPNEYTDASGAITGWGVQIGTAVAQLLGLRFQPTNVAQSDLIAAVADGRYELGIASLTVTVARAKQVDLVSYYRAGTSWAVRSGNPTGMSQNDACGRRVAVLRGSVQVDDLAVRSVQCSRASRSAIVVEPFEQQTEATAAVTDGTSDATLADSPVISAAVKTSGGRLQLLGATYGVAPYGIAVPKSSGDLAVAVRRAVQSLIDSGRYADILDSAGVASGAIATSLIYPPAVPQ